MGVYALMLLVIFLVHMVAVMAALVLHALCLVISPRIEFGQGDSIGSKGVADSVKSYKGKTDDPLPERHQALMAPLLIMRAVSYKVLRLISPLLCNLPSVLSL